MELGNCAQSGGFRPAYFTLMASQCFETVCLTRPELQIAAGCSWTTRTVYSE